MAINQRKFLASRHGFVHDNGSNVRFVSKFIRIGMKSN